MSIAAVATNGNRVAIVSIKILRMELSLGVAVCRLAVSCDEVNRDLGWGGIFTTVTRWDVAPPSTGIGLQDQLHCRKTQVVLGTHGMPVSAGIGDEQHVPLDRGGQQAIVTQHVGGFADRLNVDQLWQLHGN
jgi:hypothetical protein